VPKDPVEMEALGQCHRACPVTRWAHLQRVHACAGVHIIHAWGLHVGRVQR
jgi:hypothetical protein